MGFLGSKKSTFRFVSFLLLLVTALFWQPKCRSGQEFKATVSYSHIYLKLCVCKALCLAAGICGKKLPDSFFHGTHILETDVNSSASLLRVHGGVVVGGVGF